jgi:small nuclear ribonucleoprotein (snRNP)-like protein
MSADPASPISKVRAYLDHKMGIRLIDGRVIKGKFIALDHMGIMILANGEEFKEGKLQRSGYTYNIPVNLIAGMEDYGVA